MQNMDTILKRLEDIELTAERIVDRAEAEKNDIGQRIQTQRDGFDSKLDEKRKQHSIIDNLEKEYEENHEAYAQEILENIIAV